MEGRVSALGIAFAAYAVMYLLRKTFASCGLHYVQDVGLSEASVGAASSLFALAYACSKLPGGVAADRIPPRRLLAGALIASAAANAALSATTSLAQLAVVWAANGFVQGFAWPAIGVLIKRWCPDSAERAFWWSLVSTSQNIGAALSPVLVTAIIAQAQANKIAFPFPLPETVRERVRVTVVGLPAEENTTWRWGILLPAAVGVLAAVVVVLYLREEPSAPALLSTQHEDESNRKATPPPADTTSVHTATPGSLAWARKSFGALPPSLYLLFLANTSVYAVRDVIGNWAMLFFVTEKGLTAAQAASVMALFEAGGVAGSMLAGVISDQVHGGRRVPICVLYGLFMLLPVAVLPFCHSFWACAATMAAAGAFLFGPQTLLGLCALEIAPPEVSGFAGSLVSLCSQLGASGAGYPVSLIKARYGWRSFYMLTGGGAILWTAALAPLWNVRPAAEKIAKTK